MDRRLSDQGIRPRPKLLSVLCLLSLIGSSWVMFQGGMSAISPPEASTEQIDSLDTMVSNLPFEKDWMRESTTTYLTNTLINAKNLGALNFLFGALSLLGVYLMFRLRKPGLPVYGLAQLGLAVSSVVMGGFIPMAWIYAGAGFLVALIFIGLYATQLKYMR